MVSTEKKRLGATGVRDHYVHDWNDADGWMTALSRSCGRRGYRCRRGEAICHAALIGLRVFEISRVEISAQWLFKWLETRSFEGVAEPLTSTTAAFSFERFAIIGGPGFVPAREENQGSCFGRAKMPFSKRRAVVSKKLL